MVRGAAGPLTVAYWENAVANHQEQETREEAEEQPNLLSIEQVLDEVLPEPVVDLAADVTLGKGRVGDLVHALECARHTTNRGHNVSRKPTVNLDNFALVVGPLVHHRHIIPNTSVLLHDYLPLS